MEQYGTKEYYKELVKRNETEKLILINALENVAKKDYSNPTLIDEIAKSINAVNINLNYNKERYLELEKADFEERLKGE